MDTEYHEQLHNKILAVVDVADWIYHDVRLNCDGAAAERTKERLAQIHQAGGVDAMFGLAAAWPLKAYWRLRQSYILKGASDIPAIVPSEVSKIQEQYEGEQEKRAAVSGQQFIAAISQDDLEMAEAIFKAAWESSVADTAMLLYTILSISIKISNQAYRMR